MKKAWVYILECSDSNYYVGYTTNLSTRLQQHNSGHNPKSYTASRRPVSLFYSYELESINEAKAAEKQLKGWSRAKKKALARGYLELLHVLAECQNASHFKNWKRE